MKVDVASYPLRHPEAQRLADLVVVENDLVRVLGLLSPLRLGPTFENPNWTVQEMHWTCAVIRYGRIFGGALKWEWQAALASLDDTQRATNQRVMDERNGYIAHSVGNMEDPVPVVCIAIHEDGSKEIRAINCAMSRMIGASSTLIEQFHSLTTALLSTVQKSIEAEQERLLPIAVAIGANTIMEAGTWKGNASPSDPKRRRKPIGNRSNV